MAFSTPSLACLSFVQGYLDFVKLVFSSLINPWAHLQRLGLKRITTIGPVVRNNGDLTHHLCRETRERKPNAIKNVWRMAQAKGPGKVITLANGKLSCVSSSTNWPVDSAISFPFVSKRQAIHTPAFTQSGRSCLKLLRLKAPTPCLNGVAVQAPPRRSPTENAMERFPSRPLSLTVPAPESLPLSTR